MHRVIVGLSKSFLKRQNAETSLNHIEYFLLMHKELKTCPLLSRCNLELGLCLMCSKLLPIILLEFPGTFTYYSFVLSLIFQNYSQKIHLHYKLQSKKVMKLNPWCWLQTVNKVRYDCTIRVSERSIRVYRSFIAIIIV